jgi:hypothetical protein
MVSNKLLKMGYHLVFRSVLPKLSNNKTIKYDIRVRHTKFFDKLLKMVLNTRWDITLYFGAS